MNYEELHKLTVGRLRELAHDFPELEGVTGMSKAALIKVLCGKLNIEIPHKVVVGLDKGAVKARIREVKKLRDEALAAKDKEALAKSRKQLHHLRHKLRKAIKVTA